MSYYHRSGKIGVLDTPIEKDKVFDLNTELIETFSEIRINTEGTIFYTEERVEYEGLTVYPESIEDDVNKVSDIGNELASRGMFIHHKWFEIFQYGEMVNNLEDSYVETLTLEEFKREFLKE